jgi:DNA-directed RNA polymerase specialized sigma24 family protein
VDRRLRGQIESGQLFEAWRSLHKLYRAFLRRFITHLGGGADVEELCRGVWDDVYRALKTFAFETTPRRWLLRLAVARVRGAGTARSLLGSMIEARAFDALTTGRDEIGIERRLASLGESARELLELRYIHQLDSNALASLLESSPNRIELTLASVLSEVRGLPSEGSRRLRTGRTKRSRVQSRRVALRRPSR